MEELRNEEVIETVEGFDTDVVDEPGCSEIATEEVDSNAATKLVAGGIAVVALAGYGAYQLGKNVVVPGVKKGAGWIKDHFGKKKEAEVIDAEGEFEDEDSFEDEEAK